MPGLSNIQRILDRPLVVAVLFTPIAAAIWWAQLSGSRAVAEAVQLVMLISGAVFYWLAVRGRPAPHGATHRLAWLAALAIAAAVAAQVLAATAAPAPALDAAVAAARLANLILIAGFAEELWFRGLWMRATASSVWLSVGAGAAAFGLLHWPQGLGAVATTAAMGALYGAVRWRGAPIWALALAHGTVNWLVGIVFPAASWRFDPVLSQALFCILIAAAAAAFLALGQPEETER